jgi:hypothetical protein
MGDSMVETLSNPFLSFLLKMGGVPAFQNHPRLSTPGVTFRNAWYLPVMNAYPLSYGKNSGCLDSKWHHMRPRREGDS